MKKLVCSLGALLGLLLPLQAAQSVDYAHIEIYVAPFYHSQGPRVKVGRFSDGLAGKEAEVLATLSEMRKDWDRLAFPELYVAAIRLYDLGYRKEAVYWFYTAQYRGRQFGALLDKSQVGGLGSAGVELLEAQNAFVQLLAPYINGFGFGDIDSLLQTVEKVRREAEKLPDLEATYPGVTFKRKSEWNIVNADLADSMKKFITVVQSSKADIQLQRSAQGMGKEFSKLKNKELPRP